MLTRGCGARSRPPLDAAQAGCRVEICTSEQTILDKASIKKLIGTKCDGVIGQLTEVRARGCGMQTLPP